MKQTECTVTISKAGKNLLARIPDEARDSIGRGDKVKIVLLEKKADPPNPEKVREEIKAFIGMPSAKDKLKGTILGYPVEVPVSKITNILGDKAAEKLLFAILTEK